MEVTEENPPYKKNEAPLGTENHIWLKAETKIVPLFRRW